MSSSSRPAEPSPLGALGPHSGEISCDERLALTALPGLPWVQPGDDVAALIAAGLQRSVITLQDGDVLAVTSKILSRAEGRFVDLATVVPSPQACDLASATGKDPRLVELILGESSAISRQGKGVLVVRHRLGFIAAHAGIDCSNSVPRHATPGSGPWALLLPSDPDGQAERIRQRLTQGSGVRIGIVVTDSLGRPFRHGTVGAAIGIAGLPALWDRRGEPDIYGRKLETTITAFADEIAAAAGLISGQAAEGRPVIHLRGLRFPIVHQPARELYRSPAEDLYA